MHKEIIRPDYRAILELVGNGASVLDLGCGDGDLLDLLVREKSLRSHQGIEIDEKAIYKCVAKGLNVMHGDIDGGLAEYEDKSMDYVILNQSLQQVIHFKSVLDNALRVGRKVIVGFPNFAYYRARLQLGVHGRAPETNSLPYTWYESPNMHFFSILDFMVFCGKNGILIEKKIFLGERKWIFLFPNLFAQAGLFLISR